MFKKTEKPKHNEKRNQGHKNTHSNYKVMKYISKMKNRLDAMNSRLDTAEEVGGLVDIAIQPKMEERKKTRLKKIE